MRSATSFGSLVLLLTAALALGCTETATQLEGTDEEADAEGRSWDPAPLIITANAIGNGHGIDTTFTRNDMTAVITVENRNGREVGRFDVTLAYEISEVSDSVDLIAPGVYRLADPELSKVAATGEITITVDPDSEATAEVPLGAPRPLTKMSASRHFMLTGARVTRIRTHEPDTLAAITLIRVATNVRSEERIAVFGRLSTVYSGLVLPSIVPREVRLEGATLTSTGSLGGGGEPVYDFVKTAGSQARLVFDVYNQAPFAVPAGVPWVVSHDAANPILVQGDTVWPQVVIARGATTQEIGPGETLTIDTGLSSAFAEDPENLPEYVVIADTESVARVYPIILAGDPVRAWFNVSDQGASARHR